MPLVMTLVLFRFASGLNLYYAVQNVFSIPQQYLIARRRLRQHLAPQDREKVPPPAGARHELTSRQQPEDSRWTS